MPFWKNAASKFLEVTKGRTTAFFIMFFISGNVLAFLDRLTPVYVGFMGTLGGLVLVHSAKEDIVDSLNKDDGHPRIPPEDHN